MKIHFESKHAKIDFPEETYAKLFAETKKKKGGKDDNKSKDKGSKTGSKANTGKKKSKKAALSDLEAAMADLAS